MGMNSEAQQRNPSHIVTLYHFLPVIASVLVTGSFLASVFLTGSSLISGITASLLGSFLLWRWIVAARQVDRWVAHGVVRLARTLYRRRCIGVSRPNIAPPAEKRFSSQSACGFPADGPVRILLLTPAF